MTAPTTSAAEAETERQTGAVIGIIAVRRRIIINRRRRRTIAVTIARRRGVISRIISSLAAVFMHAAIISVGIIGLHITRRMARIVGTDGGAGNQACTRTGRGAQA